MRTENAAGLASTASDRQLPLAQMATARGLEPARTVARLRGIRLSQLPQGAAAALREKLR